MVVIDWLIDSFVSVVLWIFFFLVEFLFGRVPMGASVAMGSYAALHSLATGSVEEHG